MQPPLALAVSLAFGLNLFLLLVILALFNFLRKEISMFKDDVTAALGTQSTAIDNLTKRLPTPPDPATIVPIADQQAAVAGIVANTARIDAIDPVSPTPTPTPTP